MGSTSTPLIFCGSSSLKTKNERSIRLNSGMLRDPAIVHSAPPLPNCALRKCVLRAPPRCARLCFSALRIRLHASRASQSNIGSSLNGGKRSRAGSYPSSTWKSGAWFGFAFTPCNGRAFSHSVKPHEGKELRAPVLERRRRPVDHALGKVPPETDPRLSQRHEAPSAEQPVHEGLSTRVGRHGAQHSVALRRCYQLLTLPRQRGKSAQMFAVRIEGSLHPVPCAPGRDQVVLQDRTSHMLIGRIQLGPPCV
eukprot:scaffold25366_cov75-Phaeocystis_antarctica.AAC.1